MKTKNSMNIHKGLVSFEQAEKIKSFGIIQCSRDYFYKYIDGNETKIDIELPNKNVEIIEKFSAFNSQELGVFLSDEIRHKGMSFTFRANLGKRGLWHLKYRTLDKFGKAIPLYQCQSFIESEARAKMLINLLEKDFLSVQKCNDRFIKYFNLI